MTQDTASLAQPLTLLAEDELIFRDSVREFAEARVRPLVREMDEHARIPKTLVTQLFDLGVMGIEIPDVYGGSGGTFFHSVLAVEELSRVDPSIGVLVDVQNTLVINAFTRWGSEGVKKRYLPRLASDTVGAYALSEAGSGSDAFALTTRAKAVYLPSSDGHTSVQMKNDVLALAGSSPRAIDRTPFTCGVSLNSGASVAGTSACCFSVSGAPRCDSAPV